MRSRPIRVVAAGLSALALLLASVAGAQHAQIYVLDGFGGVHAGGGAPVVTPATPFFGFDLAEDLVYLPLGGDAGHGDGLVVLDAFGGVHVGGALAAAPPFPMTPYFGFDIARAIAYRNVPPRASGTADDSIVDLLVIDERYTVLASTVIDAPDDGFVLVLGNTYVACTGGTGNDLRVSVSTNVDATVGDPEIEFLGYAVFPDCTPDREGFYPTDNQTVTRLYPVAAGRHTVNLLARKEAGTGGARFLGRSITAVYVDQDASGGS